MPNSSRTRIRLTPDRRTTVLAAIKKHVAAEFDEPISDFRAESLLDFFLRTLGPPVYNQGVHDATAFMQDKLTDIEGEIFERDEAS